MQRMAGTASWYAPVRAWRRFRPRAEYAQSPVLTTYIMLDTDYQEKCHRFLMRYIEETTRFGASDVTVVSSDMGTTRVGLTGTYAVTVKGPEEERGGKALPAERDIVVDSREEFDTEHWQLIGEYRETADRYQVLRDTLGQPGNKGYLAYPHGKKCILDTYDREVHFESWCDDCDGNGHNTCGACRGHGRYSCTSCNGHGSLTCGGCGGGGSNTCTWCGGSGNTTQCVTRTDHEGHHHTEWEMQICSGCGGRGRQSCGSCGGTGSNDCDACGGSGIYTCNRCGGDGRETCSHCDGEGCLVRTGHVEAQLESSFRYRIADEAPEWVKQPISRVAGHAALATLATIETREIDIADGSREGKARFLALVPHVEISIRLHSREYAIRMMGLEPAVQQSGGLFQDILQQDLNALQAATGPFGILDPLYQRHAARVIGPFLESRLNQVIVTRLTRDSPPALLDRIGKAVSENYLDSANKALRTLLRRSVLWGQLRWMSILALLTPVAIFAALWFVEFDKRHQMLATQESLLLLGTGNTLLIGLPAILLAWGVSKIARWRTTAWVQRVGRGFLRELADAERIYSRWPTTLCHMAVAFLSGFLFVWGNPIWINQEGKLQGKYALPGFLPPTLITPDAPKPARKKKPRPAKANVAS